MLSFTGEEDKLEEELPVRSPAPDYTSLKKETQNFTKQVQDFFAGGKVIIEKVHVLHTCFDRGKNIQLPKTSTNSNFSLKALSSN